MNPQLVMPLAIWFISCLIPPSLAREAGVGQAGDPIFVRPGCQDTCGTVDIPFPFGIGAGCFLDSWFEIECRSNGSHRVPFLPKLKAEVVDIQTSPRFFFQSLTVRIPPLSACTADGQHQELSSSIDLRGGPYAFSTNNVFVMQGCAGSAILVNRTVGNTLAGCATVCHPNNTNDTFSTKNCLGVGCCQTNVFPSSFFNDFSDPVQSYDIVFSQQSSSERRNCLVAALMSEGSVNKYVGKLSTWNSSTAPPVELSWGWVSHVQPDPNPYSICRRSGVAVSCSCEENFYGNPYVLNGCQNPKECKRCPGRCGGSPGNYYCRDTNNYDAILGLSTAMGVLLFGIGCYGLHRLIRREREKKRRAEFFKRNGGLLLQQQLKEAGVTKSTKIFTTKELEKATDSFNENRILGQGGQGTVYKGMLSDGRIVAIKMSKILSEIKLEQFINEVVILSQINHRNVVRLLGCCLDREVPLLVYEYVPNRTLSDHIHDDDKDDDDLVINWEMRLKIATDSAGAIAYLHSSSSTPIYHRDIKSANILLDEKFRAKVSDFGSSKTIAMDQTHLTTLIQGTMGYLDPEYFQSYRFTEKSDVFSFGVVLLELLTRKKPIYRSETMEPKNLVTEFLHVMESTSNLSNILDPEVVNEAKEEALMVVVDLAKRCVSWSGSLRPTMKDVAMTLEMIVKPPEEASTLNEEEFGGNAMTEISGLEFMSNPLPAGARNSHYSDAQPLLPYTL